MTLQSMLPISREDPSFDVSTTAYRLSFFEARWPVGPQSDLAAVPTLRFGFIPQPTFTFKGNDSKGEEWWSTYRYQL